MWLDVFKVTTGMVGSAVTIAAILRGGRYERLAGLFIPLNGVLAMIVFHRYMRAPAYPHTTDFFLQFAAVQSPLLAAFGWLAWRTGAKWLLWTSLAQAVYVAIFLIESLSPSTWASLQVTAIVASLGKHLCIAWGVLKWNLGPPVAVPGQAAFDAGLRALPGGR